MDIHLLDSLTNASAHCYNTFNKHKLSVAYGKDNFMYSNFCLVGIKIWNYITDHLDINIARPKFNNLKKNINPNQ